MINKRFYYTFYLFILFSISITSQTSYSSEDVDYSKEKKIYLLKSNKSPFTGLIKESNNDYYFDDGKLSQNISYYERGNKKLKTIYINQSLENRKEYGWFDNGQLGKKIEYVNNQPTSISCWDKDANEYTEDECIQMYIKKKNNVSIEVDENNVTIIEDQFITNFKLCPTNSNIKFLEEFEYNCFSKDKGEFKSKGGCNNERVLCGSYYIYEKGKKIVDRSFKSGLLDGLSQAWNYQGDLISKYVWENNNSIYSKYLSDDGSSYIEQEGIMLSEGWVKRQYDLDNHLTFESKMINFNSFKNKYFYKNGQIKIEFESGFIPSFKNGYYFEYYIDGSNKVKGRFSESYENYKIGKWLFYDENGKVSKEEWKIDEEFWENGNIKTLKSYFYDSEDNLWVKHGVWKWYKQERQISTKEIEYEFGEKISEKNN